MDPVAKEISPAENSSGDVTLEDRLLTTKLYNPSTRTNLVTRPRLTERLEEGIKHKLTLVAAPAGFGKSTLLGEWVLRSEIPVGWLSLDVGDNDPARFLSYVISAIQTVEADVGEDALSLIRSSQPMPIQVGLTQLVNELAAVPHDLALVLDDYHVIESEAVHTALAFLLEHLPPQMHVVIASRIDPPLRLSRLLAGSHLTKLSASDLRFTFEEAAAFLNEAMELNISAEEVATLADKTEGWIAGLQLAALSLRGREDTSGVISAFTGTNRHIFDYLAQEVLDSQPEDTRTFLLETSILDRLSGTLCDAVTGCGGGQARLEKLEGANLLLVPLDEDRRWYRYHHLFSDFLRERLRRESPEQVVELHRRASEWHERNGRASEAIGHAVAAGDFDRAGDLAERLGGEIAGRGEGPALERLLKALPEEVLRARPRLDILYAVFALCGSGRFDAAEARLRNVEQMFGLSGVDLDNASSVSPSVAVEGKERADLAGRVATVRAVIASVAHGDARSSIAFGHRALRLLAEDNFDTRHVAAFNLADAYLCSGDLVAASRALGEAMGAGRAAGSPTRIADSLALQGRLEALRGRLSEAAETCDRLLRLAAKHGETVSRGQGEAHIGMGEVLLERDELQAATRHLQEGVELLLKWSGLGYATSRLLEGTDAHGRTGWPEEESIDYDAVEGVVTGYLTLAQARQVQADAEGAFEALRKADRIAQYPHNERRWKVRVEAWRARLRMAQGDIRAAGRWARERGLSAEDKLEYSPESELEHTTLARLLIAQGKHEEASTLLERLLDAAEAGGRGRTVIEVLVLKALALQAQNDEPGALGELGKALTLAEPEGYVRTFADEGAPMADLLRRVLKSQRRVPPDIQGGVPLEYIGKLLEALGAPVTAPTRVQVRGPEELVLDPITERELEILKLLDSNLSNREIAASLFVSLATVKTHTKHLYRKLGVRARHQAVARAKELRVL